MDLLLLDDNMNALRDIATNSIDCLLTDPPYGLYSALDDPIKQLKYWLLDKKMYSEEELAGFNLNGWDTLPGPELWREVMRTMKPGAFGFIFGHPRTYDLLTVSLRLAGFEIRDTILWIHSSGFPKGGRIGNTFKRKYEKTGDKRMLLLYERWQNYGAGLKPAYEPICVVKKPTEKLFWQNAEFQDLAPLNFFWGGISVEGTDRKRHPTNIIIDENVAEDIDKLFGTRESKIFDNSISETSKGFHESFKKGYKYNRTDVGGFNDFGGVSRYYYCAKESKKNKNLGMPEGESNTHDTVKPLALCRYLVKLSAQPRKTQYLDPFAGSGTVHMAALMEGHDCVSIESDEESFAIARKRVQWLRNKNEQEK